jgi:hypothetical protein
MSHIDGRLGCATDVPSFGPFSRICISLGPTYAFVALSLDTGITLTLIFGVVVSLAALASIVLAFLQLLRMKTFSHQHHNS